ncbi:MAG TPA: sigma-70 family RNA polymerase sigma factor [Acidimicrobiia bacterium]|nr:sigma-70 family RNA polymerase sigma factor [Acidimicrobiia bacterium]
MDELTRLLLAARDGDRAALGSFVRHSQGDVWRFVAHRVGPDDADDVTQDAYVRAWRATPAFRNEATARTWLLAIARRACVDALRHRGRRTRLTSRLTSRTTAGQQPDPAAANALEDLVGGLNPDRRDAFVLTQLLGCSYEEAATICGVPVGTVRSRVARARASLVEQLRDVAAS